MTNAGSRASSPPPSTRTPLEYILVYPSFIWEERIFDDGDKPIRRRSPKFCAGKSAEKLKSELRNCASASFVSGVDNPFQMQSVP